MTTKVLVNELGEVILDDGKAILMEEGGGLGDTIYLPNESGETISQGDKVLFTIGTTGSTIVPNSAHYYNLTTSFTGFATGETDSNGNYEINTVLPRIIETKIITNLEPDEVIITGSAE